MSFSEVPITSLIVVDVQPDFCPTGALEVKEGDQVIPVINQIRAYLPNAIKVFTQDYHPRDHASFQINNPGSTLFNEWVLSNGTKQMMWPPHCVQGTPGADLHSALVRNPEDRVFQKGTKTMIDSYSGFGAPDLSDENTGLLDYLRAEKVTRVVVVGLATDYCVKATAMDAKKYGFDVYLVLSACRSVSPDVTSSIAEMTAVGIHIVQNFIDLGT